VRATPAGRQFLRMTRSILEQIDVLATTTRANGRGKIDRLVIRFCTSLTAGSIPVGAIVETGTAWRVPAAGEPAVLFFAS